MIKRLTTAILLSSALITPAVAESLTQADVEKFLAATPAIDNVAKTTSQDLSEEENKRVKMAMFDMRLYTTVAEVMKDKPGMVMLDEVARQTGYEDFDAYAQVFDRVYSIVMTGYMVGSAATMMEDNEALANNPYAYVEDESNPAEKREKIRGQLKEFCEERCMNPEDMAVVAENYEEVSKAVRLKGH